MQFSRRDALCPVIAAGMSVTAAASAIAQGGLPIADTILNVKAFGAKGDGVADDTAAIQAAVNECFGTRLSPHSWPKAHTNRPLFFPAGLYRTTASIDLTDIRGAHIFGAGRFDTTIINSAGKSVFRTNGFEYCRVEMMRLTSEGRSADVFDLDWTGGGKTALQSNTFADMFFDGGAVGVNIGKSGFMGSENLFINCFYGPCSVAGIKTSNFNALQNTMLGGNIQSCSIGLWVFRGSFSVYNTGFQESGTCDIKIDNSANDTTVISGARSESPSFVRLRNGVTAHIVGCAHLSANKGIFAEIDSCPAVIDSCVSLGGALKGSGSVLISNSSFGRADWLDADSIRAGSYELRNCYVGGTQNSNKDSAKFIERKTMKASGSERQIYRRSIILQVGSNAASMTIAAGTRIQRISLVIDKPASSGTLQVGDRADAVRFFDGAKLSGGTIISPVIERKYEAADLLTVKWTGAEDVIGHVAVDLVDES